MKKIRIIVGGLPHQSQIEPASVADADKLIAWLQEWKATIGETPIAQAAVAHSDNR